MKTSLELINNKSKESYLKTYAGLYPPGAYIAWPPNKAKPKSEDEQPYRRTKAGGFIALPISMQ